MIARSIIAPAFCVAVALLTPWAAQAGITDTGETLRIPFVNGIQVDGDGADWADRGFRVEAMRPSAYTGLVAGDFSSAFRLAWNMEGLLVLLDVSDDEVLPASHLEMPGGDRVEVICIAGAERDAPLCRLVVRPVLAPSASGPQAAYGVGSRFAAGVTTPTLSAAAVATAKGYRVEALLPWDAVGVEPKRGAECHVDVRVHDFDTPTTVGVENRVSWSWHGMPGRPPVPSYRVRLAKSASAPMRMLARDDSDVPDGVQVRVFGSPELVGKAVAVNKGRRQITAGQFKSNGGWAEASLLVPLPLFPESWGDLRVVTREGDELPVALSSIGLRRAERLVSTRLVFTPGSIFAGEDLPRPVFEKSLEVEQHLLGPYTMSATYYDAAWTEVDRAATPGRYGAVVKVKPREGRAVQFFLTLYRIDEKGVHPWRLKIESNLTVPPEWGITGEALDSYKKQVQNLANGAIFRAWVEDPAGAALMSALYESSKAESPDAVVADSVAADRQWWVTLKRRLYGTDKRFSSAFVCPRPVEGKPAPVVREGTESEAGMKEGTSRTLNAICREWAEKSGEPFAVCVVRRGVIVLHAAYGMRDGKPMTVETPSWMASITKLMSAVLMLTVMDQGLVGYDDPVAKFLPPFEGIEVETPMRVHHLYTHTNGLTGHWGDEAHNLEERIATFYPYLPIGKEQVYNGVGYAVGGKIIETVTGEALPVFYQKHLLGPLGCANTSVNGTSYDARSVPLDMAKIGQMLLNGGAYGNMRFFRPEMVEKARPRSLDFILGANCGVEWGIGMHPMGDGMLSERTLGHGALSTATFRVDTDNDLVVVITRETAGKDFGDYHKAFIKAVMDGIADGKAKTADAPK